MVQYLDGNMGSYLGFAPFDKSDSKPLGYHDCGFSFDADFWQLILPLAALNSRQCCPWAVGILWTHLMGKSHIIFITCCQG